MKSFIEGVYTSQDKNINYKLSKADINLWVRAINDELGAVDSIKKFISLRLVNEKKMEDLNNHFRGIKVSTNILAFPSYLEDNPKTDNLGDIAICIEVLKMEAKKQQKKTKDHLAHLFIHGTLHLMGFKHDNECKAEEMEGVEKRILRTLDVDDPYQIEL